jgi:hypothetical protein
MTLGPLGIIGEIVGVSGYKIPLGFLLMLIVCYLLWLTYLKPKGILPQNKRELFELTCMQLFFIFIFGMIFCFWALFGILLLNFQGTIEFLELLPLFFLIISILLGCYYWLWQIRTPLNKEKSILRLKKLFIILFYVFVLEVIYIFSIILALFFTSLKPIYIEIYYLTENVLSIIIFFIIISIFIVFAVYRYLFKSNIYDYERNFWIQTLIVVIFVYILANLYLWIPSQVSYHINSINSDYYEYINDKSDNWGSYVTKEMDITLNPIKESRFTFLLIAIDYSAANFSSVNSIIDNLQVLYITANDNQSQELIDTKTNKTILAGFTQSKVISFSPSTNSWINYAMIDPKTHLIILSINKDKIIQMNISKIILKGRSPILFNKNNFTFEDNAKTEGTCINSDCIIHVNITSNLNRPMYIKSESNSILLMSFYAYGIINSGQCHFVNASSDAAIFSKGLMELKCNDSFCPIQNNGIIVKAQDCKMNDCSLLLLKVKKFNGITYSEIGQINLHIDQNNIYYSNMAFQESFNISSKFEIKC